MIKTPITLLLIITSLFGFGQATKYPVTSLPVVRNGVDLTNPWTGGFEAPEFSSADINNDGINDLFVFDRSGNKVMVFTSGGAHNDTTYHYAPEYESVFPNLTTWAVLRDYNHDGIPDIFTNQPGETLSNGTVVPTGIELYKGVRQQGNLHFDVDQYCLNYQSGGFTTNLWANGLGVPSIVDVNHDGNLDILTFGVFGSTVIYYENVTAQQGLPADSMIFSQVSNCWGNFYVSGTNLDVSLNVSCKGGSNDNPGGERHTGATMWPVEYGPEGNVNVLLSGAHVSSMVFMRNTGDTGMANMGWMDTLWPSCNTHIYQPLFPAAFQIDADNDGLNDLLITPNFGYPGSPALNTNNVMFYHRVANDTCGYEYNGNDSFLVHTTLDFGTSSKAVFFDYNSDSLMDIVVGNLFYYNPVVAGVSQLALYRNVGSRTDPKFEQITTDYMNMSGYNLLNINPAFGDLDGDGKPDMLIGDANGDLDFFKNVGDTLASFPSMTAASYFGINVGTNAAPFIYDVNNDGLPDLVIGNMSGTLAYYWNYGTVTHPQFSVDSADPTFGHINVTLPTTTVGNSQPFMMHDTAGKLLLFVGSDRGLVYEYLVDPSHLRNGTFARIDSNFLQHTVGSQATMQAHDLNGDGKMEYITGCSRGGLQLFSETIWDSTVILSNQNIEPVNHEIKVFPNPANDRFTCVISDYVGGALQPQMFNMLGQKMEAPFTINQNTIQFSTGWLSSGLYVVRVILGEKVASVKVVVEHR